MIPKYINNYIQSIAKCHKYYYHNKNYLSLQHKKPIN